jgi:hypothetical protein
MVAIRSLPGGTGLSGNQAQLDCPRDRFDIRAGRQFAARRLKKPLDLSGALVELFGNAGDRFAMRQRLQANSFNMGKALAGFCHDMQISTGMN